MFVYIGGKRKDRRNEIKLKRDLNRQGTEAIKRHVSKNLPSGMLVGCVGAKKKDNNSQQLLFQLSFSFLI